MEGKRDYVRILLPCHTYRHAPTLRQLDAFVHPNCTCAVNVHPRSFRPQCILFFRDGAGLTPFYYRLESQDHPDTWLDDGWHR